MAGRSLASARVTADERRKGVVLYPRDNSLTRPLFVFPDRLVRASGPRVGLSWIDTRGLYHTCTFPRQADFLRGPTPSDSSVGVAVTYAPPESGMQTDAPKTNDARRRFNAGAPALRRALCVPPCRPRSRVLRANLRAAAHSHLLDRGGDARHRARRTSHPLRACGRSAEQCFWSEGRRGGDDENEGVGCCAEPRLAWCSCSWNGVVGAPSSRVRIGVGCGGTVGGHR